jgi:hypothetical protein
LSHAVPHVTFIAHVQWFLAGKYFYKTINKRVSTMANPLEKQSVRKPTGWNTFYQQVAVS